MADLKPAADLQAGDIMLDPNGDLLIERVIPLDGCVRVLVSDHGAEFCATWTFDPADLVRVVTRPGVTS